LVVQVPAFFAAANAGNDSKKTHLSSWHPGGQAYFFAQIPILFSRLKRQTAVLQYYCACTEKISPFSPFCVSFSFLRRFKNENKSLPSHGLDCCQVKGKPKAQGK